MNTSKVRIAYPDRPQVPLSSIRIESYFVYESELYQRLHPGNLLPHNDPHLHVVCLNTGSVTRLPPDTPVQFVNVDIKIEDAIITD